MVVGLNIGPLKWSSRIPLRESRGDLTRVIFQEGSPGNEKLPFSPDSWTCFSSVMARIDDSATEGGME